MLGIARTGDKHDARVQPANMPDNIIRDAWRVDRDQHRLRARDTALAQQLVIARIAIVDGAAAMAPRRDIGGVVFECQVRYAMLIEHIGQQPSRRGHNR